KRRNQQWLKFIAIELVALSVADFGQLVFGEAQNGSFLRVVRVRTGLDIELVRMDMEGADARLGWLFRILRRVRSLITSGMRTARGVLRIVIRVPGAAKFGGD